MTTVVVDKPPFVLIKPKITVGDAATTLVEFECGANQITAEPDQDENTTETFCGTFTTYKPEVWTVTITALTSFGANGLWNNLRPLVGTVQPFMIIPDLNNPISEDNVAMSGVCLVKAFAYLDAAVGETSDFDLVLAVQGLPEFLDAPPAGLEAEAAAAPATEGTEVTTEPSA
ncbi:MAG TPA: hypothetical protein VH395_08855 [Jatrophihabitantaceae bacterium]|jgi:hypothetical protein